MHKLPLFTIENVALRLRTPFRIAYGVSETRQAFLLRWEDGSWGEGTIPPYYHVAAADMLNFWQRTAHRTDPLPTRIGEIEAWIDTNGPAPARSAIDLALHDRLARQAGVPLHQFLGLASSPNLPTSFTIPIDTPEAMAQMAMQAQKYHVLKIKLEGDDSVARIAAIRAARPDVRLRVDANAAWTPAEAIAQINILANYGLEMVEQPVAKGDIIGMGIVQKNTDVPIVADESVQTLADVEALAAAEVRGINLKLMKVGGISPALKILRRCHDLGLRVMLGCMVETSLGVTAMAHLASLADWVDLDAPLLIANDPFEGIQFDDAGRISVPNRAGIGAKFTGIRQ